MAFAKDFSLHAASCRTDHQKTPVSQQQKLQFVILSKENVSTTPSTHSHWDSKMRLLLPVLAVLSAFISLTTSALIISLPQSHSSLPSSSTHATLHAHSSHLHAPLTSKYTFAFPSTSLRPSTSYLLDIHARDYTFAAYRVDVDESGKIEGVWETFRGGEWKNKGPDVVAKDGNGEGDTRVEVRVVGNREFYEQRGGCEFISFPFLRLIWHASFQIHVMGTMLTRISVSPLAMLKNPIVLLGGVGLAIAVGMPYLLDNSGLPLCSPFRAFPNQPYIHPFPPSFTLAYIMQWIPKCAQNSKNSARKARWQAAWGLWPRAVEQQRQDKASILRDGWLVRRARRVGGMLGVRRGGDEISCIVWYLHVRLSVMQCVGWSWKN
jgi:hypothetical protein